MLEFEIGFEVNNSFFDNKQLDKHYLENRSSTERKENTTYLQYKGFFLELFQHYHLVKTSVTPVVSSFKIPDHVPKWFNEKELQRYYSINLLEVNPSTIKMQLREYIESKSLSHVELRAGATTVIQGNAYNIFSVMGGVRGDKTNDPVKTWDDYDKICRNKKLPALLPHLAYR